MTHLVLSFDLLDVGWRGVASAENGVFAEVLGKDKLEDAIAELVDDVGEELELLERKKGGG